jgi:hypothetical protein
VKITRILAYRVELPLHEGSYKWSGGKGVSVFDSTIVRVETDAGLTGHGEVCPLGRSIFPPTPTACARGCASSGRTSWAPIPASWEAESPHGRRAQGASVREERHRHRLLGHPRTGGGPPVCELLGGRYGADVHLYRAISQDTPDAMAARVAGYRPRATTASS